MVFIRALDDYSFLKNYTEDHQKSQNFNIFLLTSAMFRGLRSVFFNTFFFHCIRNISESLYLKNSKIIQFFLGVDCGVHSPQDVIIFYPTLQDRINMLGLENARVANMPRFCVNCILKIPSILNVLSSEYAKVLNVSGI